MNKITKLENPGEIVISDSTSKKLIGYVISGDIETKKSFTIKKGDMVKNITPDMIIEHPRSYHIMNSNICIVIKKK